MNITFEPSHITAPLVQKLINKQFLEFSHLQISSVKNQGHDNRTFRLGPDMLVRLPTAASYALQVPKEQDFLPKITPFLSISIPKPLRIGKSSIDYPFNFSIYKWIEGHHYPYSKIDEDEPCIIALGLAKFLKELHRIDTSLSSADLSPGLHNYWRGDHISIYDEQARISFDRLLDSVDGYRALSLWKRALGTKWQHSPV